MASFLEYQKKNRVVAAQRTLETKRLLWIHRPIYLHEAAPNPGTSKCPCCGSHFAHRVDTIGHLDVLVDRVTGKRRVRSHLSPAAQAKFDLLAAQAQRIDCPIRCYAKQLAVITDRKHVVIGVFGGNRGGKSSAEAEWMFDQILEFGGQSIEFWWVSKTRKKALAIGLRKLITGEGRTPPIIPRELVVSYPRSAAHDVPAVFIDGTKLHFHHASTPDGDNLKGESPRAIVLDEGCTVDHEANWTQLIMRLTDSDGQLLTATTPVLGHYLQTEIRDRGRSYDELAELPPQEAAANDIVYTTLSMRDNPWLPPNSIARRIAALGNDELKIRAEIDGEWIAIGRTLWRHFDPTVHLFESPDRDVTAAGLDNITPSVARRFFRGTEASLAFVAGMDFNVDPAHVVICQIGCPRGADQSDPKNWVLFVADEIVERGTTYEVADFIALKAGAYRRLPPHYFAGMAIVCDATGAQQQGVKTGATRHASTHIKTMQGKGFDARPCSVNANGHAANPRVLDRVSLLHKLMMERVEFGGRSWPRLLVRGTHCPKLVHSFETQLAKPDGSPDKVPGTVSDKISGPTDALGYFGWSMLSGVEWQTRKARTNLRAAA